MNSKPQTVATPQSESVVLRSKSQPIKIELFNRECSSKKKLWTLEINGKTIIKDSWLKGFDGLFRILNRMGEDIDVSSITDPVQSVSHDDDFFDKGMLEHKQMVEASTSSTSFRDSSRTEVLDVDSGFEESMQYCSYDTPTEIEEAEDIYDLSRDSDDLPFDDDSKLYCDKEYNEYLYGNDFAYAEHDSDTFDIGFEEEIYDKMRLHRLSADFDKSYLSTANELRTFIELPNEKEHRVRLWGKVNQIKNTFNSEKEHRAITEKTCRTLLENLASFIKSCKDAVVISNVGKEIISYKKERLLFDEVLSELKQVWSGDKQSYIEYVDILKNSSQQTNPNTLTKLNNDKVLQPIRQCVQRILKEGEATEFHSELNELFSKKHLKVGKVSKFNPPQNLDIQFEFRSPE